MSSTLEGRAVLPSRSNVAGLLALSGFLVVLALLGAGLVVASSLAEGLAAAGAERSARMQLFFGVLAGSVVLAVVVSGLWFGLYRLVFLAERADVHARRMLVALEALRPSPAPPVVDGGWLPPLPPPAAVSEDRYRVS